MWALSIATKAIGGRKIVTFRKMRLKAVYSTALRAQSLDLPTSTISPVFGLKTSIPACISVCLINQALRNPALAQAKNELKLLSKISWAPVVLAARPLTAALIPSAIVIELAQAAK